MIHLTVTVTNLSVSYRKKNVKNFQFNFNFILDDFLLLSSSLITHLCSYQTFHVHWNRSTCWSAVFSLEIVFGADESANLFFVVLICDKKNQSFYPTLSSYPRACRQLWRKKMCVFERQLSKTNCDNCTTFAGKRVRIKRQRRKSLFFPFTKFYLHLKED